MSRAKPTSIMPLTPEQAEREAKFFHLLSNETRLRILDLLREQGPTVVFEIAETLGVSSSAVSQHLGQLRLAGMVDGTRKAQQIFYHLTPVGQQIDLRQAPQRAGVVFR